MSFEEEVDYSYSDCEPSAVNSKSEMQESPSTQKTEMELLREENLRLKELLKRSTLEVVPTIEPALPEPQHANVEEKERSGETKGTTNSANGMSHSSKERALLEQAVNDLHGNAPANASNEPTSPHSEEGAGLASSVTSAIVHIGENVVEAGKKLLGPLVPPLLVDLPPVDPHLPMEPPCAQSSQQMSSTDNLYAGTKDDIEAELPSKSPVHITEAEEQASEPELSVPHADPGPQAALEEPFASAPPLEVNTDFVANGVEDIPHEESVGYHSATSATSPPFDVDEALIFRAKENAARREGVENVCPDFVRGKCTLGDECPLSHDAVPETHCPTFNTTGQCFDELCPLLHRLVEDAPAATVVVLSSEGQGQDIHPVLGEDGAENSAPAAEREMELAAGTREDHEMQLDSALKVDESGLANADGDVKNCAPVEETVASRSGNEPSGEPAAAATAPIVITTTSTTTTTTASVPPDTAATIAVDDESKNSSAQDAAPIIATTKTITTTINTHPSPAVTYVGSKVPGTSRDTPFDLLLDTYQHHSRTSRSTSPAKTLASTIHSTRPAAVVVPPTRSVVVSAKTTTSVTESKKPEEGEVCEKASTPVVPAKKGKSRFDEDAPTGAAGATTTTTGSSVATLPLPNTRDGPTTVSTVSSATGGGRPSPGICYNFKKGACDRGNSCRFSHDLDSEPPSAGVCYAFRKGNCDQGDTCRFRHVVGACYNYRRGACDRGESCMFSHAADAVDDRPNGVCFEFRKGTCKFGENCRFRHDQGPATEICRAFQRGDCSRGNTCYFRHEQDVCRDHQRGNCHRGDCCPYAHDNHRGVSAPNLFTPTTANSASAVSAGPCYDFMKGSCTFGDECRFSHSANIPVAADRGVCSMFQRGECDKGDACWYRHELETCRAFQRGNCRNGDRCNYHHPTGTAGTTSITSRYEPWPHDLASKDASSSHYQPPPGKRGRSPSRSPSPRHGPSQRSSLQRSPSRSPSRGRRASRSHEEHRQRGHSNSRERTDSRAPKLAKRDHSPPHSQHRSQHQHSRSPQPPRDPPRYHSDHDYDRGRSTHPGHPATTRSTHSPPSDHAVRPVTASTATSNVSHYAGMPPIEEAVFGEADADTQRRARESEKRRSIIDNPCARAYAGKCELGDRCAFSHDVIPYAYCRLYNNTGCCHKVECPYIHQLYQYRGVSDSIHSQQGSSRRGRSPSPPIFTKTGGSERSRYDAPPTYAPKPASTFNKYAPASPSPPRHHQTQHRSQSRGHHPGYAGSSHKRARSPSGSPPRAHSPPRSGAYPQHHTQSDSWERGRPSNHYQNRY